MRFDPAALQEIGAAHVADALTKLKLPKRFGPPEMKPAFGTPGLMIGRALPAKHFGSVDVFLAAFEHAEPGDILVADNEARLDEGCIGDLIAAEAKLAGLAALVIHGAHRDTAQLREIGLPVWSLGHFPFGPTRMRPTAPGDVMLGSFAVTDRDIIVGDEDGVIVTEGETIEEVLGEAALIAGREEKQRAEMRTGRTLREQLKFGDFIRQRAANPALSFREHINKVRGAVET
ncbi:MAG: RraA family protein [Rhodospirillaceae bacterium]